MDGRVVKRTRTRVNHRIEGNVEQWLIQAHSRKLTQLHPTIICERFGSELISTGTLRPGKSMAGSAIVVATQITQAPAPRAA